MKATGIVRRIDDLGRVVIPKEIRRMMQMSEGNQLEIFVSDNMVCFKKYGIYETYHDTLINFEKLINRDFDIENKSAIYAKINELKELLKEGD